jgi:DNA-binding transcriptional regulator GbsR (MarR family)|tara:strand:+ start:159 stop:515 length:357 start_codon:yes stop_codon:yes gene_type:complete
VFFIKFILYCSEQHLARTTTVKTISKFRVRQKLQVISKLGDRHVVLGQKRSGVAECFFIVRDNFERVLQSNPSIPVDAEVQRNKETGLVSVVNHSDEKLPLCDFANNITQNVGTSASC